MVSAFSAISLLLSMGRGGSPVVLGAAALFVIVDISLGLALLTGDGWPRIAAIVRSVLGLVATLALPLVARGGGAAEAGFLMKLPFFAGMLVLLPGAAGTARRWTGSLVALVPYFAVKFLGGAAAALEYGSFDIRDFWRVFFGLG